jgi:hypothetical protein
MSVGEELEGAAAELDGEAAHGGVAVGRVGVGGGIEQGVGWGVGRGDEVYRGRLGWCGSEVFALEEDGADTGGRGGPAQDDAEA